MVVFVDWVWLTGLLFYCLMFWWVLLLGFLGAEIGVFSFLRLYFGG